jgi:serine/threonine protein phosphatase PrpC
VSEDIIKVFFEKMSEDDTESALINHKLLLRQLAANIINEWRERVEVHFNENEITPEEQAIYDKHYSEQENIHKIYGATLVLAAMSEKISFVVLTGDSPCLVFGDDGSCRVPPETINPDCEMGFTTSLSDTDAITNFRYFWTEQQPKAIMVCSDGVKDSYSENDFNNFGAVLLKEMEKDHEAAFEFTKDWLPKLSERGSGDDMSIAGIYQVS